VSRFNPTPIQFAANDSIIAWNLFAPRIGVTYDVFGDQKTVLKANYGQYWWNPGADFVFNVSENAPAWWRRHAWTDTNNNNRWDAGEEGRLIDSRGGRAAESIDPNLKNSRTDEVALFLEREVIANFGVRAGYVWRGNRNLYQRENINRPLSAFTVPFPVQDPGPDGRVGTGDDGGTVQAFDLDPAVRALPVVNQTRNSDLNTGDFHTFEITGTKRMSNRWSALISYGWTKSYDNGFSAFQGNAVRQNTLPATPNDLINTDDGRFEYTRSNFKLSGTYQAPWGVNVSPMVRYQQGFPFGRTFAASGFFVGNVRVLAEPMGTQRQDAIVITDLRVEKEVGLGTTRKLGIFFDLYNMLNANPAQNLQWSSGTSYDRPLSVVPPRLARIGAKLTF
jgi:hypothetical protein